MCRWGPRGRHGCYYRHEAYYRKHYIKPSPKTPLDKITDINALEDEVKRAELRAKIKKYEAEMEDIDSRHENNNLSAAPEPAQKAAKGSFFSSLFNSSSTNIKCPNCNFSPWKGMPARCSQCGESWYTGKGLSCPNCGYRVSSVNCGECNSEISI